jgi:hypothetical protein
MDLLLELILWFLWEFVLSVIFESVAGFVWMFLKHAVGSERKSVPFVAAIGQILLGISAGVISLVLVRQPMAAPLVVPGLSLIVAPLATGLVMHWLGAFWYQRTGERPALFTFRGGAVFAFAMALTRFLHFQFHWPF